MYRLPLSDALPISWRHRLGWVVLLSGPPRACGLVLLRACAAALESATASPLAFTIEHPANGLTASGAAVARLAAARLLGWFMAPWPVAQGDRKSTRLNS